MREPVDPVKMAQRDMKKALPKRFYTEVTVGVAADGFVVLLDGKPVRTPGQTPLILPSDTLAHLLAAEWRAQAEWIEPDTMPATRLVNSAIDGVTHHVEATVMDIVKFSDTDLVCYRAGDPAALVEAQARAWDPMLAFARASLAARFICIEGVMYVAQPDPAKAAVRDAVEAIASEGVLRLAALSVMTSLTGSVIIALAITRGTLDAEAAWAAAHVDEDFQARHWDHDAEAVLRRDRGWREMQAAVAVFALGAVRSSSRRAGLLSR